MADDTLQVELDERGIPLRLYPAAPSVRPTESDPLRMRFSRGVSLASGWLILYTTWMVLLLGSLYTAILLGQRLAGYAAALASPVADPTAHAAGATLGFASWIAAWLWHMMRVQGTADAYAAPDRREPLLTWENEDTCA